MATTTYGSPYVENTGLVSAWPGVSLNVAQRIDSVSYAGNGVNAQTGTTYTLVLTDAGKNVTLSNASAVTVTVPTFASVAYAVGTVINLTNLGAGTVTVAAAGTVTVNGSPLTLSQYTQGQLLNTATNTWVFTSGPLVTSPGLVQVTPTSIANSGGSSALSGGAVTFTSVASISVNGAFTSTYANYQIIADFRTATANGAINYRMRAAGTDDANANYSSRFASLAGTYTGSASSNATQWPSIGYGYTSEASQIVAEITNPQASVRTVMQSRASFGVNTNQELYLLGGQYAATTSFDGFSLICASTNVITGTIRIYGYKN